MEEKLANARLLIQQKKVEMSVLVDGMDEAAHRRFGRLPNMVYVVDMTGRIVYKSMWTRHQELREFLRELLQTRDENRNDQKQAAFS
jgi:hypothetical protein